jgi:NAD(P)-dependent dehydrogenase (short-subunit alcohol dehydrogenase family)
MAAGGNWWRANEIRHLTRQTATRYRCDARAGAGQAIAIGLAEVGADVALFDLGASWGQEDTAEAIADRCRRYLKLTGEVSDAEVVACALTSARRATDWAVSLAVSGAGMTNARRACTDTSTYGARA